MVSESEHRSSHHFPAGLLRVARGQEVVGAVLQAALAGHHRHLSQGSGPGQTGPQEDHRPASQADSDEVT